MQLWTWRHYWLWWGSLWGCAYAAAVALNFVANSQRQPMADTYFMQQQQQEQQQAERQKFMLDMVLQVHKPLLHKELIALGDQLVAAPARYDTPQDSDLLHFLRICREHEYLQRGQQYSELNMQHLQQFVGLCKFFSAARDWRTFQQNVAYARLRINAVLFVFALSVALRERTDASGLWLPPMNVMLPQLFYERALVLAAENVAWQRLAGDNAALSAPHTHQLLQRLLHARTYAEQIIPPPMPSADVVLQSADDVTQLVADPALHMWWSMMAQQWQRQVVEDQSHVHAAWAANFDAAEHGVTKREVSVSQEQQLRATSRCCVTTQVRQQQAYRKTSKSRRHRRQRQQQQLWRINNVSTWHNWWQRALRQRTFQTARRSNNMKPTAVARWYGSSDGSQLAQRVQAVALPLDRQTAQPAMTATHVPNVATARLGEANGERFLALMRQSAATARHRNGECRSVTRQKRCTLESATAAPLQQQRNELLLLNLQQLQARFYVEQYARQIECLTQTNCVAPAAAAPYAMLTTGGMAYQNATAANATDVELAALLTTLQQQLADTRATAVPQLLQQIADIFTRYSSALNGTLWQRQLAHLNDVIYTPSANRPTLLQLAVTQLHVGAFSAHLQHMGHMLAAHYQRSVMPHTLQTLNFPAVQLVDVTTSRLATFEQHVLTDLSNLLDLQLLQTTTNNIHLLQHAVLARQRQLNYRAFNISYALRSTHAQYVIVRTFLLPRVATTLAPLAWHEQQLYAIRLDSFVQPVTAGVNRFARASSDISWTAATAERHTLREMYARVADVAAVSNSCAWPQHLLLPRGAEQGLPMQLFVFVAPFDGLDTAAQPPGLCGFATASDAYAGQPLRYPFDRGISQQVLDMLPNALLKEVLIMHEPYTS